MGVAGGRFHDSATVLIRQTDSLSSRVPEAPCGMKCPPGARRAQQPPGVAAVRERLRRGVRRVIRGLLSWASLLAIPLGIAVGLNGYMTLGALLVLGGTLAYFLVDPIMLLLDLKPSEKPERDQRG